jgi:hypothetical protein
MCKAENPTVISLRERIERGRFHFDRKDASPFGGAYGFFRLPKRCVCGPTGAHNCVKLNRR